MIQYVHPFLYCETKNTCLVLEIKEHCDKTNPAYLGKKFLSQRYYGKKIPLASFKPEEARYAYRSTDDYLVDIPLTSVMGNGNNEENSLEIVYEDKTNISRFFYETYHIIEGGVYPRDNIPHARKVKETLQIVEVDDVKHIKLLHEYSFFEDTDVIVKKTHVMNESNEPIRLLRCFSLCLALYSGKVTMMTYDGASAYERKRHSTTIEAGSYFIDSKNGASSHKHNPFVELYLHDTKDYMACNLIYDGNHKEMVDVSQWGSARFLSGISDANFEINLMPKQEFCTPEACFVVSKSRIDNEKNMHKFVLHHILPDPWGNRERPILYNSWEGSGMNVSEDVILDLATRAKDLGMELFVLDDGWFKGRNTDHTSLGDWVVDQKKFPCGLRPVVEKVHQLGMKFGLWFEPEMISKDSDLYREHPEYTMKVAGREPIHRRQQWMLDMTNEDAVSRIFQDMCAVIDEIHPDYIKWDYNRCIIDIGSAKEDFSCGEYMYKYMMGSYNLMKKLTERYPDILFEGCSSGGGRFDLGLLYYMPQIWGSDNTNTYCRIQIAEGTLQGYPPCTFGAHYSKDYFPEDISLHHSSFEDRFNIHAPGAFGYELELSHLDENEKHLIKEQVKFYKAHRALFQFGEYSIIESQYDNTNRFAYRIMNPEKTEAIFTFFAKEKKEDMPTWKCFGLDENSQYWVQSRTGKKEFLLSGKELLEKGIPSEIEYDTITSDHYNGVYSVMLFIKKHS